MAAPSDARTMRPLVRSRHDRTSTSTELQASPPSAAWLRIFALVYDPFLWLGEIAGMRSRRSALLGNARGRVVEIGAGTGLNIAHYPDGIAELVLTEPDAGDAPKTRASPAAARARRADRRRACGAPTAGRCVGGHRRLDARPLHRHRPRSALCARSHACSARTGSCCSSNTCARARGSSRRARTSCSNRGAASQAGAAATARPWS